MARKQRPEVMLKNAIRNSTRNYRKRIKVSNDVLRDPQVVARLAIAVEFCESSEQHEKLSWAWDEWQGRLRVQIDEYLPGILASLCTTVGSGYEIASKYAQNESTLSVYYNFKELPMTVCMVNVPFTPQPGDLCKIVRSTRVAEDYSLVCPLPS